MELINSYFKEIHGELESFLLPFYSVQLNSTAVSQRRIRRVEKKGLVTRFCPLRSTPGGFWTPMPSTSGWTRRTTRWTRTRSRSASARGSSQRRRRYVCALEALFIQLCCLIRVVIAPCEALRCVCGPLGLLPFVFRFVQLCAVWLPCPRPLSASGLSVSSHILSSLCVSFYVRQGFCPEVSANQSKTFSKQNVLRRHLFVSGGEIESS